MQFDRKKLYKYALRLILIIALLAILSTIFLAFGKLFKELVLIVSVIGCIAFLKDIAIDKNSGFSR